MSDFLLNSKLNSLGISQTQFNANTDYYGNGGGGGGGVITASAFTATGEGQPEGDGRFIARGDASAGAPALAFQMRKGGAFALQQWSIGMTDAPAGANSGNNLAIVAYDDASVPLSTPLSINRATGAVEMGSSVTVGDGSEVGGALLEVNGTLGLSRVYDGIYNQPQTGGGALLFTASVDGVTGGLPQPAFIAPVTGTYVLSLTIQAYAPSFAWTPGTSALLYGLTYNAGLNIVAGGQLYCPLITNPAGMGALIPGLGAGLVEYQNDIIVELVSGTSYSINPLSTGTINLGTGGNVGIFIVQLFA